MSSVLIINGSYRDDGITDQAVGAMAEALRSAGAHVEVILLREEAIEFCLNCRACTQDPGEGPGSCVLDDAMTGLVEKIERADAYVLASPTNFSSVTAVYKRFMERLVVYAYWPWSTTAPTYRKARTARKKAVLISSCAAPGPMGRWMYHSRTQLKLTAKTIGADVVGTLFTGLISQVPHPVLCDRTKDKAKTLAAKLM